MPWQGRCHRLLLAITIPMEYHARLENAHRVAYLILNR